MSRRRPSATFDSILVVDDDACRTYLMDRSPDMTRLALRADWATFCVIEQGAARIATRSGVQDGLPIEQAIAGVGETDSAEPWRRTIHGVPVAAAPLVAQGKVMGVLCAGRNPGRDAFSLSDAELLAAARGIRYAHAAGPSRHARGPVGSGFPARRKVPPRTSQHGRRETRL